VGRRAALAFNASPTDHAVDTRTFDVGVVGGHRTYLENLGGERMPEASSAARRRPVLVRCRTATTFEIVSA
jgi:hypothetical protein